MKRKIKIGNDGYGGKNITVTKTKYGIVVTQTNPHDWGRVSGEVIIPVNDVKALIEYLNQLNQII